MDSEAQLSTSNIVLRTLAVVFLYALTVFVRLESLHEVGLQSDERLWVGRSAQVLKRASKDLRHVTSHLPHPGVPTTVVVAIAQNMQAKINERRNCGEQPDCELHILDASRIGVVFFTSLFVPLVFLMCSWLLGAGWAFFCGVMLALDPRIIAYTRMVHIDGTLMVFFLLTLLLYFKSIRNGRALYTLFSGVAWGACLLTKPPGALLLPILFAYRLLRRFFLPVEGRRSPLLQWRDVWAVVLAHIVFVLCFTRLWDVKSSYISRLHVQSSLARWVLQGGRAVQQYDLLLLAVYAVLLTFLFQQFLQWKRSKDAVSLHLTNFLGLFAIVLGVFSFVPVVLRNLVLYWTWVSGLSGVRHEAFGHVLSANTAPGYVKILAFEMPVIVLTLFVVALIYLPIRLYTEKNEKNVALLTLVVAIFLFLGFLGTSSKQALRYALPVLPLLYVLATFGVRELLRTVQSRVLTALLLPVLVFSQVLVCMSWSPYYQAFFNYFAGGLQGGHHKGIGYLFAGQIPAIAAVVEYQEQQERPVYVVIAGDKATAESVLRKHWPDKANLISFGHFPVETADLLLLYPTHRAYLPEKYHTLIQDREPLQSIMFQSAPLAQIYELPFLTATKPVELDFSKSHRLTGSHHAGVLVANAKEDDAGYLYFSEGVRLVAGKYQVRLRIEVQEPVNKDTAILRLELGGNCKRDFYWADVQEQNVLTLPCTLKKGRAIPRIYWYANASVAISTLAVERFHLGSSGTEERQ